jgi:hypothetical protein
MAFTLFKGNLEPSLWDTIRQRGRAVDLSAVGTSVKLYMRLDTSTTLKINGSTATIISASSTLSGDHSLPDRSITLASATGFLPNGALNVGTQVVEYQSISGNTFLGCSGGEGTMASGTAVSQRGGVRYDPVAGDVDTAGDYVGWWKVTYPSAKEQETPTFEIVIEDPGVVFRGLCEYDDVISHAPGYEPEDGTDALLQRMIMGKSRLIQRETGREFVSIFPALTDRRFDIQPWHEGCRKISIGDAASVSSVEIYDVDQATLVPGSRSPPLSFRPTLRPRPGSLPAGCSRCRRSGAIPRCPRTSAMPAPAWWSSSTPPTRLLQRAPSPRPSRR